MASQDYSKPETRPPLWGILGGMGPLASAEFLSTIYRARLDYKLKLGPLAMEHSVNLIYQPEIIPARLQIIMVALIQQLPQSQFKTQPGH